MSILNGIRELEARRKQRRDLWIKVVSGIVTAENCMQAKTAINWADEILKAFDTRFPIPFEPSQSEVNGAKNV